MVGLRREKTLLLKSHLRRDVFQGRRGTELAGAAPGWRGVEPRPRARSRNVRSLLANPGGVQVRYLCVSVLDKLWAIILR